MQIIVIVSLVLATIVEGTLAQIPITLILLLILFVLRKNEQTLVSACLWGAMLDLLSFRTIGLSSMYFVAFLFLVSLYDRKYEITTIPFVTLAAIIGAVGYSLCMGYQHIVIIAFISPCIALSIFLLTRSSKLSIPKR